MFVAGRRAAMQNVLDGYLAGVPEVPTDFHDRIALLADSQGGGAYPVRSGARRANASVDGDRWRALQRHPAWLRRRKLIAAESAVMAVLWGCWGTG